MTATVEDVEAWAGKPLPEPYRSFLNSLADDFLASNDLTLMYSLESILERNETFESKTYCPGFLVIGDDSGGTAMVLSLDDGSIHSVGMGAMTPDCFEPLSPSFRIWADAGFMHANAKP